MRCANCQHFNDAVAKFCTECAAPLALTCVQCAHPFQPTAKFCPECGHATGLTANQRSPFGAPDSYTPTHLARRILNSKSALEGERKQVTVLFADLKGSMELLAERDPEEARKLLDPILEHMMEAVHHYEGTVNLAMGDGIMALFGAPIAHEDHAVRACYAALRMQERVKRHAQNLFHADGLSLQIRVGLNSGEVVVRAINSDLHMDYSAIGRTTHLASRMEQLARPGSILLTPSTLELADGFVTVKSLGPVPVKGLAEPIEIHEVIGVGPVRTRLQAVARRGLTPFVGRDTELEQLRRAQQRAHDGHGQVSTLVAEAGVGKSRLVYELTHAQRTEGWMVLECAAVSYGKTMSYLPIVGLLKSYFEIEHRDSVGIIGEKVEARLLALDSALESTLPALLSLLDVPVGDGAWQMLDPTQRRRLMLDAVRDLVLRQARSRPLLLVFEDLHWIDDETQALLDGLVENLGSARILLLATYRPEYKHGWSAKTYYSQMRLDPLPVDSAEKLLDALLGDDLTLGPLKQRLVRRGNPFFLEETVRTLVETKALEGVRSHYRLVRAIDTIQVPATVQVMLAARVDRLSPEDKQLLQIAAVVGRHVPFSLLRAVAGLPDQALRSALERLQTAEFVYETGLFPNLEYTFKHALTQDVAYGGLLQDSRRELHARIVDALESLHQGRLGEQVELLAHHTLRGELREKAVSYLFQAGLKAGRHSALRIAAGWYDQAILVLEALPDSQYKLEKSFDIRIQVRSALTNLGETRKALQPLREAEALAEKLNDERRRGLVYALMCVMNCYHGELDEALACGARALATAERIGDASLRFATGIYLQATHLYQGEYERVVELATGSLAVMPAGEVSYFGHGPGPIMGQCNLVRSLAELGRFTEAARHTYEVLRLAEPMHVTHAVGMAHLSAGLCLLAKGDWLEARPLVERGLAEYRKGNVFISLPHAVASLARILAQVGDVEEASCHLQEGEELLKRRIAGGTIDQAGMDYHWLGRAALLLGRLDDALELADCSLQYSPSHAGFAAHARHLLGDIASHPDLFDAERSEGQYREALAIAEARRMQPLVAHCNLGLGRLYITTGRTGQACDHLGIATTLYRKMDMRFWLDQAEAFNRA